MKKYILLFLLLGRLGFSQTYNFRTYSEDQGLPQTYIYCISQSAEGYLYLSTGEGLSVFDGNKFTTFTTKEIAGNLVTTHLVDSRKTYWAGHLQSGVSFLKDGAFHELKTKGIEKVKITQLAEDRRGNIWIATLGNGLYTVDSLFRLQQGDYLPVTNINSILFDQQGRMIAGTTEGLFIMDVTDPRSVKMISGLKELSGKNIKQVIAINEQKNRFWLNVEGEGVYGAERQGDSLRVFTHIQAELASDQNNISCIYSDRSENLWVSLFGEGLRKIVFNGPMLKNDFSVFKINKTNGLKNPYVQCMLEDFEGNMWFGTFGGGLIEKPTEKFSFYRLQEIVKEQDVKKLVVDKQGTIWIGNREGLMAFDPETNRHVSYTSANGFQGGAVTALHLDTKGYLWIGTASRGIFRLDTTTRRFENFSEKKKLVPLTINDIIESQGEVVIATDEGIVIYDQQSGNIQFYTTAEGLLHNNLLSVFYDSRHRLWVSSHGAPPYYIARGQVQVLKDEAMTSFNINAITEDKQGDIWIASEGEGVFKYDGKRCVNYKMQEGLVSNYCYGIAVDSNNAVWVTHKNGLSEKKARDEEFHSISGSEGLLFVENNLNAVSRDANGDLWFGTTEGLVHYNAEVGQKNIIEPRLSILNLKLNEESYLPAQRIVVPYGYYSVHINFLAISLTNPEMIRYKYRLLGIDSAWRYTSQRFVDYPNLSDGEYTFEVKACNSEGLWNKAPVQVSFVIRQPIWKKVWFYLFLILVIVFGTYAIILWRTQNLKRSQRLLKLKVRQKTFLLQREKEEVEKIKTELEHKNKDILDSITYARRIQDSLLPPDETLNDLFDENYFIFYKPKDIVSGDFYWASKLNGKEGSLSLAAVADCTGHGVPGAFISIVASSFLKQSLAERFANNIGEVLDYLNKHITATLNQSSKSRYRISDGMDLAVIAIDYKRNKLYYAGANNAIYIFRKAESDTQLFELKPTKQAIGNPVEIIKKYESQEFDLQAGDTIYMFSDGFPDQFGGEKDKKFNYRRFREMLSTASEMPVSLQRSYLEQCFEAWKGNAQQTDDVCVMGLKI